MRWHAQLVWAQVSADPSAEGLPGAEFVQTLINWASQIALWGSLAALPSGGGAPEAAAAVGRSRGDRTRCSVRPWRAAEKLGVLVLEAYRHERTTFPAVLAVVRGQRRGGAADPLPSFARHLRDTATMVPGVDQARAELYVHGTCEGYRKPTARSWLTPCLPRPPSLPVPFSFAAAAGPYR